MHSIPPGGQIGAGQVGNSHTRRETSLTCGIGPKFQWAQSGGVSRRNSVA